MHKLYQQQLLQEGVLKQDDIKRMTEHIGGALASWCMHASAGVRASAVLRAARAHASQAS